MSFCSTSHEFTFYDLLNARITSLKRIIGRVFLKVHQTALGLLKNMRKDAIDNNKISFIIKSVLAIKKFALLIKRVMYFMAKYGRN